MDVHAYMSQIKSKMKNVQNNVFTNEPSHFLETILPWRRVVWFLSLSALPCLGEGAAGESREYPRGKSSVQPQRESISRDRKSSMHCSNHPETMIKRRA